GLADNDDNRDIGDGAGEAAYLIQDPPWGFRLEVVTDHAPGLDAVDGNAEQKADPDGPGIGAETECACQESHAIEAHANEHRREHVGKAKLVVGRGLYARTQFCPQFQHVEITASIGLEIGLILLLAMLKFICPFLECILLSLGKLLSGG